MHAPRVPEEGPPDHDLIQAIAARDATALGQLYDRFSGVLMALGLRVLIFPAFPHLKLSRTRSPQKIQVKITVCSVNFPSRTSAA